MRDEISVRCGVPQCTVLDPLTLLIYINDTGENITFTLRLFADNIPLYCAVEIPQGCLSLQDDLKVTLIHRSCKWQMRFNISKCKSLSCITRKKSPILHQYLMNGKQIEAVRRHPYLEVGVTYNLNWSNHTDKITTKANRSLGFVKRNLKKYPEQIKEQVFKSLVRSHLVYASSV